MKIIKVKNIGPFLVGVLDGGAERVYLHGSEGFFYNHGGKWGTMRKEIDAENINMLNNFILARS